MKYRRSQHEKKNKLCFYCSLGGFAPFGVRNGNHRYGGVGKRDDNKRGRDYDCGSYNDFCCHYNGGHDNRAGAGTGRYRIARNVMISTLLSYTSRPKYAPKRA